jgi:hypothetical protein
VTKRREVVVSGPRSGGGKWRRVLLCAVLQLGVLAGVPVRPDEVVRLMESLSRPRAERVDPDESDRGSGSDE